MNEINYGFLPISKEELIKPPDFVCVTGDAYVDHPSFGIAIISRLLESLGFTVSILAQPRFSSNEPESDFMRFGKPKYGFFITGGNIDSMVAHYTAAKRKRSDDSYSPGGKAGLRPDRAVTVYSHLAKRAYPDVPVIIGGLEASLRRFAHYDYWDDKVRQSVLIESGADILVYGMGEIQTKLISKALSRGENVRNIDNIRGTCVLKSKDEIDKLLMRSEVKTDNEHISHNFQNTIYCQSYEKVIKDKKAYASAFKLQSAEQDAVYGKALIEQNGDVYLLQNPPMSAISREEFDKVYALPYMRNYHPTYEKSGGVPAIIEVEFSIIQNRGCFGNCNFCSIAFHQGRQIVSRSKESILDEASSFTKNPSFKGYIHDVGGPTANFRNPSCKVQIKNGLCKNKKCLTPNPCPNLEVSHSEYLSILREMRKIKGIKKVFVRSGLRFDYMILDKDDSFFKELVEHHISGQLKVAPEHSVNHVLELMGKPPIEVYKKFSEKFYSITKQKKKEQYLVPYLISSHPGCTLKDAVELAVFLKRENIRPEQVQDFYPTPGTMSTCMFYTGLNPLTNAEVYVPKSTEEKAMQRALIQYYKPQNKAIVIKALKLTGKEHLIGKDKNSLISQMSSKPINDRKGLDYGKKKRL
jgi:uncharacterized radical SAM protein YgiQ